MKHLKVLFKGVIFNNYLRPFQPPGQILENNLSTCTFTWVIGQLLVSSAKVFKQSWDLCSLSKSAMEEERLRKKQVDLLICAWLVGGAK